MDCKIINFSFLIFQVGLPVLVCQARFIALCVFSIFAILWNSLVGMVLLSVCRTNTMGTHLSLKL